MRKSSNRTMQPSLFMALMRRINQVNRVSSFELFEECVGLSVSHMVDLEIIGFKGNHNL
jgi:hypothetical protein